MFSTCDGGLCFPAKIPPSFTPPLRLIPAFEAVARLKAASRECDFEDPDMAERLWARAKAIESGEAELVEEPEV